MSIKTRVMSHFEHHELEKVSKSAWGYSWGFPKDSQLPQNKTFLVESLSTPSPPFDNGLFYLHRLLQSDCSNNVFILPWSRSWYIVELTLPHHFSQQEKHLSMFISLPFISDPASRSHIVFGFFVLEQFSRPDPPFHGFFLFKTNSREPSADSVEASLSEQSRDDHPISEIILGVCDSCSCRRSQVMGRFWGWYRDGVDE